GGGGGQNLRQGQRSPRRESAAARLSRRNWVAGEKFDFGGAAEQNLRHERRNQQRNGEIHDRPSGDNAWRQDRQRDGREHVAFAGSDDNAVIAGDFAVSEDELQSAL